MTESLVNDVEEKLRVEMQHHEHEHSADFMDLYSRQIGAYGIELMGKLARLQVYKSHFGTWGWP